jgi:dihydroorotase-like cyclic amidohydrolase
MLDLAILGGDVVTPQGTGKWSVGVKDGKIAFVGLPGQPVNAAKVINATGKLVEPGGIELHTQG